jgi:pimeloyl-ACP methyl ester carboxylesterase
MRDLVRTRAAGTDLLIRPGRGMPVVLLHGIGSDAAGWAPAMAALEPSIPAIAWDAPGYRGSARLPALRPSTADYADRLAAVLDALGMPRVVLAGHSLGALFAASFAATRADRVAALALVSPAQGYRVPPGGDLAARAEARIGQLRAMVRDADAAARAGHLMHRPQARPDMLARLRAGLAGLGLAGYAQAVHALATGDLVADAAGITCPSLVAYGTEDIVTPPSGAARLMAVLPAGTRLELVPDTGHTLPQEHPGIVAAMLARLRPAT